MKKKSQTCSFIFNTPWDNWIYITWKQWLNGDICTHGTSIMDQQSAEDTDIF